MQPTSCGLFCGLFLTLFAPAGAAAPQGQDELGARALMFSADRSLAAAADTDGDGAVTGEEWAALTARLKPGEDGSYDTRQAAAVALLGRFDFDGDGVFTAADVVAHLEHADTDSSGTLERAELEATYGAGGSIFTGLLAFGLDVDGDVAVDAEEWAAAVSSPSEPGALSLEDSLVVWFERAEAYAPEDRGAIAPSVFLQTFKSGFDLDRNGRLDDFDLAGMFTALDTGGDGALSAEELSAQPSAPRPQVFVPESTPESASDGPREPRMPWQRTLEDALALSRSTQKPLLICVNMDGEAASESLARGRYTDPEFARLAGGFVPVLASPDRHNLRDHDGRGARIEDPKFGRVIDAEHIDIEPALFERYFNNNRVAPRHVGVAPDGTILFDIYLINDLSIIDSALEKHGNFETALPDPTTLDEAGLLASPDASARSLLEARFLGSADESERVRLTAHALDPQAEVRHPELIRIALRDPSRAVRGQALASISGAIEHVPLGLIPDALRAADGVPERRPQLAAALMRRAASVEADAAVRWRRLGRIAGAVELDSPVIEVDSWKAALAGSVAGVKGPPPSVEVLLETLESIGARKKHDPDNARLDALFAHTALRAARVQIDAGQGNPGFLLEDARAHAVRAGEAFPEDPAVQAVLASVAHQLSDFELAGAAAGRALEGLLGFAELELTAEVLNVFADTRVRGLYERLGTEEGWPRTWVADVVAAYEVLLEHPYVSDQRVIAGLNAMGNLELFAKQGAYLRRALERFPTSPALHEYLRLQALRDGDVPDLAQVYERPGVPDWARASWDWYAGLAYLVAAEQRVADGDRSGAVDVYQTSIERFDRSVQAEPQYVDSAAHYVGLAWSGISKVLLDRGDLDGAIAALRESAQANADGFTNTDGLGNSPLAVARALVSLLERTDRADEAGSLGAYLKEQGVDL